MPAYGTIISWVKKHEAFKEKIQNAKVARALHFEEQAIIAAESAQDKDEVPAARLRMDAYQWGAEVNDPATYGKKTTISGDASRPLQIVVVSAIPMSESEEKKGLSNESETPSISVEGRTIDTPPEEESPF
jgi:hypothetical protein